jgi:DNA-binding CsgD family transcriptional regulator
MEKPLTTEYTQKTALTPREQEVCNMLLAGYNLKEIASTMNISYETARTHQKNIYAKLGVKNLRDFYVNFLPEDCGAPNAVKNGFPDGEVFSKDGVHKCNFIFWHPLCDNYSVSDVKTGMEEIDGKTEECVTISGVMSDAAHFYSGAHGTTDETTLKALRTMKSFSFKALGDGGDYTARLATIETLDGGDHYFYKFFAEKDKVISVTVNVPDDLVCLNWSGRNPKFNQNNIVYFKIQKFSPGPYRLKVWDITLFQ